MEKAELTALMTAHGGRAQTVASLHVLRAGSPSDADQAFLVEHAAALSTLDLLRWLGLAGAEQRPAVIDALARFALAEPARFEHEIARALGPGGAGVARRGPGAGLTEHERAALTERLRGQVPDSVLAALSPPPPARPRIDLPPTVQLPAIRRSSLPPPPTAADTFDPADLLGDLGLDSPSSGGALSGLLGDIDSPEGAPPSSRTPVLDELLAGVPSIKGARARAAWKQRALAAAEATLEDWSASVARLPPDMRDAAAARAASSPRADERAALLEWLHQSGAPRGKLVDLTLSLLAMGPSAENVLPWLGQTWLPRLLSDRARWAHYGAGLLGGMIEQRAYSEMDSLFAAAASGASLGAGLMTKPMTGAPELRATILLAFFEALAAFTQRAVAEGLRRNALAGAAALAGLGVPSRRAPELLALARKRASRGDIAVLLTLAVKNARSPKHLPRTEDFVAAVHILSDALS